jgi:hypothetical protein
MDIVRHLTAGELQLAQSVFGNSINYNRVKIHSGRFMGSMHKDNFAKTNLSNIFMHNLYQDDFSKASPRLQELFIHEMAHVWQNSQLAILTQTVLDFKNQLHYNPKAYEYKLEPGKDLLDYGIEQQASIIARFFALQKWDNDPVKTEPFKRTLKKFLQNPAYAKKDVAIRAFKTFLSPNP